MTDTYDKPRDWLASAPHIEEGLKAIAGDFDPSALPSPVDSESQRRAQDILSGPQRVWAARRSVFAVPLRDKATSLWNRTEMHLLNLSDAERLLYNCVSGAPHFDGSNASLPADSALFRHADSVVYEQHLEVMRAVLILSQVLQHLHFETLYHETNGDRAALEKLYLGNKLAQIGVEDEDELDDEDDERQEAREAEDAPENDIPPKLIAMHNRPKELRAFTRTAAERIADIKPALEPVKQYIAERLAAIGDTKQPYWEYNLYTHCRDTLIPGIVELQGLLAKDVAEIEEEFKKIKPSEKIDNSVKTMLEGQPTKKKKSKE